MKRMHIHLNVNNLGKNIQFYSTLFAAKPNVQHDDYAKWMLDDPRVNFAISDRSTETGIDHLGIQTEDSAELKDIKQRLDETHAQIATQEDEACCYMKSDKHWVTDPQGIAWESFHSLSDFPTYTEALEPDEGSTCCAPAPKEESASTTPESQAEPKGAATCGSSPNEGQSSCC